MKDEVVEDAYDKAHRIFFELDLEACDRLLAIREFWNTVGMAVV